MTARRRMSAVARRRTLAVPEDPPVVVEGSFVIGATAAQIQSAPRSGTEWTNLKRQADDLYTFVKDDGATDGSGNAVAGALVYVATGDTAYKNKVMAAVNSVESSGTGGWWHAAANRKLGGWALAAHLVGHKTTSWHTFLKAMLTQVNGGPGRSSVMARAAWDWDNNHGGAAMGSYIMICAVTGLTASTVTIDGNPGGVFHANKWLRGFCGDHTASGFGHVDSTSPTYAQGMGVTSEARNRGWHMDEAQPYGIGPTTGMWGATVPTTREGAVPSDVVRGTTENHPTVGTDAKHYVYGNAGRRMVGAVVLAGMGYPDIWTVGDDALYRWRANAARFSLLAMPEGANNKLYDPIVRKVYGRKYDTSAFSANSEKSEVITGTEWLALIPDWPVRPSSLA